MVGAGCPRPAHWGLVLGQGLCPPELHPAGSMAQGRAVQTRLICLAWIFNQEGIIFCGGLCVHRQRRCQTGLPEIGA